MRNVQTQLVEKNKTHILC